MSKNKTSFKTGKGGGRPPNAKNKKTLILSTFAQTIVEGGMERFKKELNSLKGKYYVDAFITLLEYVIPKLARTEVTGDNGAPIQTSNIDKFSFEQLYLLKYGKPLKKQP